MTSILLMLSILAPMVDPLEPAEVRAKAAYTRGLQSRDDALESRTHFLVAAKAFDELCENAIPDLPTARARANSWLLAGEIGHAIAAYRQALHLFPESAELLEGYEFARAQITLPKVAEIADACRPMPFLKSRQNIAVGRIWLAILVINGIGWVTFLTGLARGQLKHVVLGIFLMALSWLVFNAWENGTKTRQAFWATPIVVTTKTTVPRTGNNAEFPKLFPEAIPAGVEVEPLETRGDWIRVKFRGDFTGWISLTDVVRTEP